MSMKWGNRELRVALIVATALIGCADDKASRAGERLGNIEQAFGVETCDDVAADVTFQNLLPSHISPPTYDSCDKSYVVELENYWAPPSGGRIGSSGGQPPIAGTGGVDFPSVRIGWADPITRVKSPMCHESWVGGILYRWEENQGGAPNQGAWVAETSEPVTAHAQRVSGVGCVSGQVVLGPLVGGVTYRVAATARTYADETLAVQISTWPY